jgi:hypothetical protein
MFGACLCGIACMRILHDMSEGIEIHPRINLEAALLTFNWVSCPGCDAPSGAIGLTHGYIERIDPLPLRDAVAWNIAVFPIPKFGFIQGPLIEPDIICAFMQDMEELLFTHGFIVLWDPHLSAKDAQEIVSRVFERAE